MSIATTRICHGFEPDWSKAACPSAERERRRCSDRRRKGWDSGRGLSFAAMQGPAPGLAPSKRTVIKVIDVPLGPPALLQPSPDRSLVSQHEQELLLLSEFGAQLACVLPDQLTYLL